MHDCRATSVLEHGDEEEEAAGHEAVLDLWGEIAEKEHGVDDHIEGAGGERLSGEFEDPGIDWKVFRAGAGGEVVDRDDGGIDGGDIKATFG